MSIFVGKLIFILCRRPLLNIRQSKSLPDSNETIEVPKQTFLTPKPHDAVLNKIKKRCGWSENLFRWCLCKNIDDAAGAEKDNF